MLTIQGYLLSSYQNKRPFSILEANVKSFIRKHDQGYNAIPTGRQGVPEPQLNRRSIQIQNETKKKKIEVQ